MVWELCSVMWNEVRFSVLLCNSEVSLKRVSLIFYKIQE